MDMFNFKPSSVEPTLTTEDEDEEIIVPTKNVEEPMLFNMPKTTPDPVRTNRSPTLNERLMDKPIEAVDPLEWLGMGAVAGGLFKGSSHLINKWKEQGISDKVIAVFKNATPDQQKIMIKNIESNKGTPISGEMISGVDRDPTSLFTGDIPGGYAKKLLVVPKAQAEVKKRVSKFAPAVDDIDESLNEAVQKQYKFDTNKVNLAYKDVKDSTNPDLSYNIGSMRDDLVTKLREKGYPEPVIKAVRRNLYYNERNLNPTQAGALKQLPELDDAFNVAASDMATLIKGKRKSLKNAKTYLRELNLEPTKNKDKISALDAAITKYTTTKNRLKETEALLPNIKNINEPEFFRLINETNRKRNIAGGDISKNDPAEQEALRFTKNYLEEVFQTQTDAKNPGLAGKFKNARKEAAIKFGKYGSGNKGNVNFPELGKMVDKKWELGQDISKEDLIGNIVKNPTKINNIGNILEETNPGIKRKMMDKWLNTKIGTVRRGKEDFIDFDTVDLDSLSSKLNDIISDPDTMKVIESTYGSDKVIQLQNLYSVSSGLNKYKQNLNKLPGSSVSDYIGKSPTKLLKVMLHKLTGSGVNQALDQNTLSRLSSLLKNVNASSNPFKRSMAEQELSKYVAAIGSVVAAPTIVDTGYKVKEYIKNTKLLDAEDTMDKIKEAIKKPRTIK